MTSQDSSFEMPPAPNQKRLKPGSKPILKRWWFWLILIFLFIFLVVFMAMAFYVGRVALDLRSGKVTPEQLFGSNFQASGPEAGQLLFDEDDPGFGPADAKVVIVEFGDFQCPFCLQVYPVVKEILKDYGDQVLFVFRDFPLTDIHPQALPAALAAECAHEQGKFWQMHDKIFENQEDLSEASLKTWAVQIGLNSFQFSNCLDSGKYLPEVEQDLQEGFTAGVRATPTFFINGQKIEGVLSFGVFEQIIVAALGN